jgi:diguanylate cyclase (GGDEF)-like protein/PAS domain S-box-containing protein
MSDLVYPFLAAAQFHWLLAAGIAIVLASAVSLLRYRRLYQRTLRNEQNYATLVENLSEGIYRALPDGRQISANRAMVRLNGYSSEAEWLEAVRNLGSDCYVQPHRRQEFHELLQRDGRVEDFVSEVYRHKTRERIWISESARLVRNEDGVPLFYEGSVREITDTVRRLSAEDQLQRLSSQLPGALFQFTTYSDGHSAVHYLSAGSAQITGVPIKEMMANPELFTRMVMDADKDDYRRSLQAAAEKLEAWDHEFRIRAKDGTEKWVHLLAYPERLSDGIKWHGYLADISMRKRQELEIEELAFFDPLTRLPNRRTFFRRMSRSIADCAARGDHGALLFIDLDNFKTLNDTQGHDIGDRYLVEIAERLLRCVSARDLVARIGGDEFVIVLEQPGAAAAQMTRGAIIVAGRILSALRCDFQLGELTHTGSASVGIVVFDGSEPRVEQVLKRADIAMYQAKSAGRNGMALFDPATLEREQERYQLLGELRVAFAERQLELHYQPQFDHNRALVGAEALVRWRHPTRGLIGPEVVVSLVSQFGLTAELSAFVLENGLNALAAWQRDPISANLRLALNMSLETIGSEGFLVSFARSVVEHNIDPRKLTFELIEHVNTRDQQRTLAHMRKLKELGIRLSLDDFGTGYSSLTFLKNLPFDEVKIDGSFVADIEKGDTDRALIKTMLSMASNLGLIVVAEHVENVRQEAYLRAFGCDLFQGFLYAKPLPEQEFLKFVRAERSSSIAGRQSA